MHKTIGFIGYGNMGCAIVQGILKQKIFSPENVFISDIDTQKVSDDAAQFGFQSANNTEAAKQNILILAVKPIMMATVLTEIQPILRPEQIIVTIAVGLPIDFYKDILGSSTKVVRVMPNTPVAVGEGMTAIAVQTPVTHEDSHLICTIFNAIGKTAVVDEKLMNVVSALAGSGPALVDLFIESLADGAVRFGLPRQTAYEMAAQMVLGSAKLALETGNHPGVLKDQVCSPGGTTIEAVSTLEKHGFRYATIDAISECVKKAEKMG